MITQIVNPEDPILGFVWGWIQKLSKHVKLLHVAAYHIENIRNIPKNTYLHELSKRKSTKEKKEKKIVGFKGNKHLKIPRLIKFVYIWIQLSALILRLRLSKRINLVFAHMCPEFVLCAAPICKIFRIPIILWYLHPHVDLKLKLAHSLVVKVVTGSVYGFRINSSKRVCIGHGIYIPRMKPRMETGAGRQIILCVGRVSRIKNFETAIKAMARVSQLHSDAELHIVGPVYDRKYFKDLQKLVDKLSLEGRVRFIGPVAHSRIGQYYLQSTLFVQTRAVSLDKAPLEAMAYNLCVLVCSRAFDEVLGDLKDYCYYTPRNYEELARKIVKLLDDPDLRQTIGRRLRERVEKIHGLDAFVRKLTAVMENVVMD